MTVTDLVSIDSTGYHYADYPTFLAFVQDTFRGIYGADVYLESDSQDGQWLAVLAQALFDTAAQGAATYSSFSPSGAQGVGLSRVVQINGISRRIPTFSTSDLTIGGTYGTVLTAAVAEDTLGQKWDIADCVIGIGGTVISTATAQDEGAINALAGTITRIFTPTRGWQTVTNVAAATPGDPVETDAELRARQEISTANPSLTVMEGTVGAVANVTGVTSVRGYENPTGTTDGNGIPAHSISIVALGGDAVEIAQTIALHKTPGTGTYGTTSETVTDSRGMPIDIHFYRPVEDRILVAISLTIGSGYSSTYGDLIKAAVADYINSLGIGSTIFINKLIVPASLPGLAAGLTYTINTILISISPASPGSSPIVIPFNEIPTCDVGDVTVST